MAVKSVRNLECPISWFVNMTKIGAAIPDIPFLPPEVNKAELMVDLLPIILTLWLCFAVDNYQETIFKCEHAICRPMRKVMFLLMWMGGFGVMIMLPLRLLANGYGLYELYPYLVGFLFMFLIAIFLRLRTCLSHFGIPRPPAVTLSTGYNMPSWDAVRQNMKEIKKGKEIKDLEIFGGVSDLHKMFSGMDCLTSHVRHMIELGSVSVRLAPVVVMLVLIATQWNPLHILIMLFYWICLNIAVTEWPSPNSSCSQIGSVSLHDENVNSVIQHLGLSPLQIFLHTSGCEVFNMIQLILSFARLRLGCYVRMIHKWRHCNLDAEL